MADCFFTPTQGWQYCTYALYSSLACENMVKEEVRMNNVLLPNWRENVKTDCYFYTEEQDMNATIPWCSRSHKIIEQQECNGCKSYITKSEINRIASQIVEERMA